ncbi:MAG: PhoH family protein [Desulfobacter sp.]|uniref:PhoH family protein n=1 Tax=uncultured Desulfobacter sp. TaxID=240139 RepID=UPI0029C813C8|nr:PhoH family protein [uncultured Desulfobacter sp.]MCW8801632.1 PhoH family protein [Desulfobacter sp.]
MKNLEFQNITLAQKLFGTHNANLEKIARAFDVKINSRGGAISVSGSEKQTDRAIDLISRLYDLMEEKIRLTPAVLDASINAVKQGGATSLKKIFTTTIVVTAKNKPITPRTPTQLAYTEAIKSNDILFGIGPAGTGKTYLAMAMAVAAFTKGDVEKIILTRPAVEAGEALGFLPGDLAEKINPYLRPLYDALYDMLDFEKARAYIEQETIEIAPIAFMRGRTLNNAFIILDEAQNTTSQQMKMFLTRIGYGSKAIITGDITQTDLPGGKKSGLVEARKLLGRIKGISFIEFSKEDVVRHRLVSDIISAYEKSK